MALGFHKRTPLPPTIIRIPRLGDMWVHIVELPDYQYDPNAIDNHSKEVSLGHYLLTINVVDRLTNVVDHQCGPVVVSVNGKPHATAPLVSNDLDHSRPIILVNHNVRVNEEEYPILLLGILLSQEAHLVYSAFVLRLHPGTHIIRPAGLLCLWSVDLQNKLCHQTPPSLTHPHRLDTGVLIQDGEAPGHNHVICCPWGAVVHKSLGQTCDNFP